MEYLYIIQFNNEHWYKIGKAKNPTRRLYNLQCGSPKQLTILKTFRGHKATIDKLENLLHTYIDSRGDCRHMRGEWYYLSPYCLRMLLQVRTTKDLVKIIKNKI